MFLYLQRIDKMLREIRKDYSLIFEPETINEMDEALKIAKDKEIHICVFGEYNCGKSTFLNCLIQSKYVVTFWFKFAT